MRHRLHLIKQRLKKTVLYERTDRFLERFPFYWARKYGNIMSFPKDPVVLITIDSLRHDVALRAETPNFDRLFAESGAEGWIKVGSHGTYTLPSHISMFHAGIMPCDNRPEVEPPYNRDKEKLFKAQLQWERTVPATLPTPAAPNIVKGFERLGYRTVGVGGVHWFNDEFLTSRLWGRYYFREFYWETAFDESHFESFEKQIEQTRRLGLRDGRRPCFFFLNISCTHRPYMDKGQSVEGQIGCMEHVDSLLPDLLAALPERCHMMILSDHGECFGEDGFWGHCFYHPMVMEVPFVYLRRDLAETDQGG